MKIIFEDNHLLVVEKPPGILSQKDKTGDEDMSSSLKIYLKEKYHKPGNVYLGHVHRLDRTVGGVMVFAKTSKCASRLSEQMRKGAFDKKYLAVVEGYLKEKQGVLIHYLNSKLLFHHLLHKTYFHLIYHLLNILNYLYYIVYIVA